MKLPKDQPFWTSVILHLVVLVALFLATIIETLKPKEKPHVFEMVSPPTEQTSAAATSGDSTARPGACAGIGGNAQTSGTSTETDATCPEATAHACPGEAETDHDG